MKIETGEYQRVAGEIAIEVIANNLPERVAEALRTGKTCDLEVLAELVKRLDVGFFRREVHGGVEYEMELPRINLDAALREGVDVRP